METSIGIMKYHGFVIRQTWKGIAVQPETGVVREDNDFEYWSTEYEVGGRCHSTGECIDEIDEFLSEQKNGYIETKRIAQ